MTRAIPETIAEKRKTIGIRTLLHHGFALMEPKMNPTYPWRRKADGIPMIVIAFTTFLSNANPASLTSFEKREMTRWIHRINGFSFCDQMMISLRYVNQISS